MLELLATLFFLMLIIAFSKSYLDIFTGKGFSTFINALSQMYAHIVSIQNVSIKINETHYDPFLSAIKEPYIYSFIVLFFAFLLSLLLAGFFATFTVLAPSPIQKGIKAVAFVIASIPDVIVVFSIQLSFIWVFEMTDVLIVDPIAGFDNVYVLPIVTMAILPSIFLFQMMVLALQEEETKLYVEFVRAKGFSKSYILFKHILPNILITVLSTIQYVLWFMLSNLLITEYLFNMNGFFRFLYMQFGYPNIFFLCIAILFIPLYFLDVLAKWFVVYMTGEGK